MEASPLIRVLEEGKPGVAKKGRHGLGESDEAGAAQGLRARGEEWMELCARRFRRGFEHGVVRDRPRRRRQHARAHRVLQDRCAGCR